MSNPEDLIGTLKDVLLEYIDDMVILLDSKNVVNFVNPAALKYMGISKYEVVGHTYQELEPSIIHSICNDAEIIHAVTLKTPQRQLKTTSSGESWDVIVFPLFVQNEHAGTVVYARYVGMMPAELVNQIKEFHWRTIFNALGYPVLILDADNHIIGANRTLLDLFGLESESDILGRKCYEVFHGCKEPITGCPAKKVLMTRTAARSDGVVDQMGRTFEVSAIPLFDEDKHLNKIFHVAVDVTDISRAKESAQLFLDVLTHDIGNILQAIEFGLMTFECKELDNGTKSILEESINRINRLVKKARLLEGLEETPLSDTSLKLAIEDVVAQFKTQFPNVKFNLNLPADNCIVRANRFLPIMLSVFVENAIVHNQKNEKQVWIEIIENNSECICNISDNGDGVPDYLKESLLTVLRRFGGIGILQAKLIASRFGVRISIHDRFTDDPQGGTIVSMTFPLSQNSSTHAKESII